VKADSPELRCADSRRNNDKKESEEKMNFNSVSMKRATSLLSILCVGFLLAAWSPASAQEANQVAQAQPFQPSTPAAPGGNYEEAPIINASQLLPVSALSGNGFYVQQQVPTNGAMGQYTIVADPSVFQNDAGTYEVESLDLLKIRLTEMPAIAYLTNVSQTGVFANALAQSALRPVAATANMVMHPMDTVTGLPSGIGSFFDRVSLGVGQIASSASNSFGSGAAAGQTANATMTALGYDQVRRDLAKKLHVDPYSSNPILTKKLNKVAWVMFSARLTVDAAMMAVPASIIISGVEFTNDLVYQEPKADLIILVQNKLQNFGLSQEEIASFISNSAIPISLQVSAVKDLDALGQIPGRHAAAVDLGNLMTEYQARFIVTSLHMLAEWSQQKSPITGIQAPGLLIGTDSNGTTIMPAPVDYVSWTQRIAGFATDPQLMGLQNRVLWITGGMTPLANQQLVANGWRVHQGAQP
jgi:hypothetical protein